MKKEQVVKKMNKKIHTAKEQYDAFVKKYPNGTIAKH